MTSMQKSLWWYKLCWILLVSTLAVALLHAPGSVTYVLCVATALAGGASAAYLERVKATILTDFIWFLTPAALLLFPLALCVPASVPGGVVVASIPA